MIAYGVFLIVALSMLAGLAVAVAHEQRGPLCGDCSDSLDDWAEWADACELPEQDRVRCGRCGA